MRDADLTSNGGAAKEVSSHAAPYFLTGDERERLRRAVDRKRRERLKLVDAVTFVRDLLMEGPRDPDDLVIRAKQVGICKTAVLKAAARLRVEGRSGGGPWSLPED
jgi:hypothetical protein